MDNKEDNLSKTPACVVNDEAGNHAMEELDHTGVLVKPKWRGTSQDKMDMEVLGRHQVLRVRRRKRCATLRSLHEYMLTGRVRGIFDFYPCSDLEVH